MTDINWEIIKPSALLRVAVEDTQKAERRDDVVVNMDKFASFSAKAVCKVCFAGCVLLGIFSKEALAEQSRSHGRKSKTLYSGGVAILLNNQEAYNKVISLDFARRGDWRSFLTWFYRSNDDAVLPEGVISRLNAIEPNYDPTFSEPFHAKMLLAANILEQADM